MSIRTRLLLLVLAVWLPAAIGFGLLARSTYLRETDAARQRVAGLGRSLSLIIESRLDERAAMGRVLAATRSVRDGDLLRFHEEASAAVHGSGNWAVLVSPTQQLVNTRRPAGAAPLSRPADVPWVEQGSQAVFTRAGPLFGRPGLSVMVPVAATPPRYNVGISFDTEVLQQVIAQVEIPPDWVAAVIDQQQRVIARNRDPQKWLGSSATGDVAQRARERRDGFAPSVTLDGVPSFTYVAPALRYGWTVVIGLPQSALTASARRVTVQAFSAAGVLLAIGLLVAWAAARRIGRPMLALRSAAAVLGRDAVPPVLSTGVSEADEVSRALHDAGLRAQDATRLLESRVAEAVRQAEDAQARLLEGQKHEAIGRLTGGLAHDFNNLLQTIRTGLHLLERTAAEGPQRRVLDAALRATAKAAELVRHMLAFGRAQPLQPQPIALHDFVLRTQELTARAVEGRARLSADIEPGLPPVMADATQLELALLNLVFNARDAMPDGGQIVLRARRADGARTAGLPPGDYICLAVQDNGRGMDAATLARVFEPYFTTKPVGAGSGLGLAQVQSFARQSGGDVHMHSTPGEGSCVTLVLPVADAPAQAAVAPRAEAPGRALSVLFVEDDVLVSSVIVSALQGAGHRVQALASADAAAELLERGAADIDVVFTDVVMPGRLNGMDLAARCAQMRLPVVVATGYTTERTAPGLLLLRKPYGVDELLAALQQAVDAPPA